MQAFFRATKHVSHATFPTLMSSIPIYNWLMDEIEDFQEDNNRSTKVKNAARAAMEKLKKILPENRYPHLCDYTQYVIYIIICHYHYINTLIF